MAAASTSETSFNYQITRRSVPEDSSLHTLCNENLKFTVIFQAIFIKCELYRLPVVLGGGGEHSSGICESRVTSRGAS
jgi:hypothetical protein